MKVGFRETQNIVEAILQYCVLADRMCAPIEPTMKGMKDMKGRPNCLRERSCGDRPSMVVSGEWWKREKGVIIRRVFPTIEDARLAAGAGG